MFFVSITFDDAIVLGPGDREYLDSQAPGRNPHPPRAQEGDRGRLA